MLTEIIRFEWRYHLRQVAFYAGALLFFLLGFTMTANGFGPDNVAVNSPFLVMESFAFLSLISLFVVAVFASSAVLRDDEHRMSEILYSTPVGRFPYLFGRFSGAFLTTLSAVLFSMLGSFAATFMPTLDPARVAAMDARPYLYAFSVIAIPNVLFTTALLFAVAVLTRSAIATYAAAVVLYIFYFVCAALTESPLMAGSKVGGGGGTLGAMLDPFALTAFFEMTRHWTAAAKNTAYVPFTGALLINRIIWIAATSVIALVAYRRFSFRRGATRAVAVKRVEEAEESSTNTAVRAIEPKPSFARAIASSVRLELRALLTKPLILLFLLWLGLAVSQIYSDVLDGEYRSTLYPATGLIIAALRQPLSMIGTILIIYYGAEIFWREQRFRMASIVDSTPISGSAMVTAKLIALAVLIASLILGGIACGVAVQISKGYFQFEPFVYLALFYFAGLPLLLLAAASLFIHSLSPGKYAGMVIVLLFAIVMNRATSLGLEHPLWRFGSGPPVPYTDFMGFGHRADAFHLFMLHWTAFAVLLLALTATMWRRIAAPLKERLRLLRRPNRTARAFLAIVVVTGGWIFYTTNIAQAYETSNDLLDWKADYEKKYKAFERLPRPRITAVDANVDLHPSQRRYRIAGRYTVVNDSGRPMKDVLVTVRREARVKTLAMPNARLAASDPRFNLARFEFQRPLAPNERAELRFDLSFDSEDDSVVENGSFLLGYRFFPSFGYRASYELKDPRERRKRGLTGSSDAAIEDVESQGDIVTSDEQWIDFAATVSTEADQIAVAPGALERTWERDGRRWFRYRSESPILNRLTFTSARYAVAKRQHGPVAIEIYYHPSHATNVAHMVNTVAATLDVMEKSFAPYSHRHLRVVEVPVYWRFGAFAMPQIVLFTENRGFLTDIRDPNRLNLVTRRVAHEVAHQWFGNHVVPPSGEGGTVIVESLTKYSELLVLEKMHGREEVRRLLELEMERYLSGRASEENAEVPLYRSGERQPYLFYSKGALVLHAIRDLIGQEAMDGAIRNVMAKKRPTTVDLVRELRAAARPEDALLIDQWMKSIVLYDLRLDSAQTRRRADGQYDVQLRITAGKVSADGRGIERPLPIAEEVEIALEREGKIVYSGKHVLRNGANDVRIVVDALPQFAAIDPWFTRVDRNPSDNGKSILPSPSF